MLESRTVQRRFRGQNSKTVDLDPLPVFCLCVWAPAVTRRHSDWLRRDSNRPASYKHRTNRLSWCHTSWHLLFISLFSPAQWFPFVAPPPFPHVYLLLLLLTSRVTPDPQLTSQPDQTVEVLVAMVTRLLLKGTEENGASCCSVSTLREKDVVLDRRLCQRNQHTRLAHCLPTAADRKWKGRPRGVPLQ